MRLLGKVTPVRRVCFTLQRPHTLPQMMSFVICYRKHTQKPARTLAGEITLLHFCWATLKMNTSRNMNKQGLVGKKHSKWQTNHLNTVGLGLFAMVTMSPSPKKWLQSHTHTQACVFKYNPISPACKHWWKQKSFQTPQDKQAAISKMHSPAGELLCSRLPDPDQGHRVFCQAPKVRTYPRSWLHH